MEIVEKYGRAFFIEILAHGVPLKKDGYEQDTLLDNISSAITFESELDVETLGNRLRFYTKEGLPVVGIVCESAIDRLVFTMPGDEPNFEFAQSILDVLFTVVKTCLDMEVFGEFKSHLHQQSFNPSGSEEDFECDDDFSI